MRKYAISEYLCKQKMSGRAALKNKFSRIMVYMLGDFLFLAGRDVSWPFCKIL